MPASIGVNLRVTGHCRQGGRKYMEDFFSVAYQQTEDERDLEYAFFGIFDGHGGAEAASFAKEHLMETIIKHKSFWSDHDEDVLRAIKDGYIATHYAMWKEQAKWPKTASGLPSTAGTTASVAFIRRGKIYVGHVGDSGIILGYQDDNNNTSSEWKARPLTRDHKPENIDEMTRINECGGKVVAKSGVPRVVWNRPKVGHQGPVRRSTPIDEIPFLAVARSLGDLWSYNSQINRFIVSPDPDCAVYTIDTNIHRCLIFGTDGLFNMLSAHAAVHIVQHAERHNEAAALLADTSNTNRQSWLNPSKMLVERALERWCITNMRADNTSVVTLMLDPPGPPRAQVLKNRKQMTSVESIDVNSAGASSSNVDNDDDIVMAASTDTTYPDSGLKIMTRFVPDGENNHDHHHDDCSECGLNDDFIVIDETKSDEMIKSDDNLNSSSSNLDDNINDSIHNDDQRCMDLTIIDCAPPSPTPPPRTISLPIQGLLSPPLSTSLSILSRDDTIITGDDDDDNDSTDKDDKENNNNSIIHDNDDDDDNLDDDNDSSIQINEISSSSSDCESSNSMINNNNNNTSSKYHNLRSNSKKLLVVNTNIKKTNNTIKGTKRKFSNSTSTPKSTITDVSGLRRKSSRIEKNNTDKCQNNNTKNQLKYTKKLLLKQSKKMKLIKQDKMNKNYVLRTILRKNNNNNNNKSVLNDIKKNNDLVRLRQGQGQRRSTGRKRDNSWKEAPSIGQKSSKVIATVTPSKRVLVKRATAIIPTLCDNNDDDVSSTKRGRILRNNTTINTNTVTRTISSRKSNCNNNNNNNCQMIGGDERVMMMSLRNSLRSSSHPITTTTTTTTNKNNKNSRNNSRNSLITTTSNTIAPVTSSSNLQLINVSSSSETSSSSSSVVVKKQSPSCRRQPPKVKNFVTRRTLRRRTITTTTKTTSNLVVRRKRN